MTNSADADQLAKSNSADPDQLAAKPTDLDLHCLLSQGMSCSAREGLNTNGTNSSLTRWKISKVMVLVV